MEPIRKIQPEPVTILRRNSSIIRFVKRQNDTDTGDADNPNAKYRENIQNFYYADSDGANAPYFLEFSEVNNTMVNNALKDSSGQGKETILSEYNYENGRYGYYENVYSDLTTEIANNIFNKNYTFLAKTLPAQLEISFLFRIIHLLKMLFHQAVRNLHP